MAAMHGRRTVRTDATCIVGMDELEHELTGTRQEIRIALRERKQLPEEIQNAAELADEVQVANEFELKRLRSREERFRNLAANLEELESGPLGQLSDEHTERYFDYLEELHLCTEGINLLQEEIELARTQLEELDAEEAQLDDRLDALTDERDRLVEQRNELIIKALPIEPDYYDLVRVRSVRNGQMRVYIGREDIPGAYAIYRDGRVIIPKRFVEQLSLLRERDGMAAD